MRRPGPARCVPVRPWIGPVLNRTLALRALRHAVITSTGSYVPWRIVTHAELGAALGGDVDDSVRDTLGIHERRWSEPGESITDMAAHAARIAILDAGVRASDVDLLVVAADMTNPRCPGTASALHERVALRPDCGAFDINGACAGFAAALDVAWKYVRADERYQRVLVVAAHAVDRSPGPVDERAMARFGDGAGAVMLEASEEPGILCSELASDGPPAGGMGGRPGRGDPTEGDGEEWPRIVRSVLGRMGAGVDDVDLWLWAQADRSAIEHVMETLGQPLSRTRMVMDRFGDTGPASLPLALDDAVASERLRPGDLVVLAGIGAGPSMGCVALRWTRDGTPNPFGRTRRGSGEDRG